MTWLPLQFSVGLEPRLLSFVSVEELRRLRQDAENELPEPARWGTTFTVIQSWARKSKGNTCTMPVLHVLRVFCDSEGQIR
jgi:hypothetical protein